VGGYYVKSGGLLMPYSDYILQQQINQISVSGTGATVTGGSTTLSGVGGIVTSMSGGVWYVDGKAVAGIGTVSAGSVTVSGIVVQVLQTNKTDMTTLTANGVWTDVAGMSLTISPMSSGNKMLVNVMMNVGGYGQTPSFRLIRNSAAVCIGDAAGSRPQVTFGTANPNEQNQLQTIGAQFLDSPPTSTSGVNYKIQCFADGAVTVHINGTYSDANTAYGPRATSSITAMEFGSLAIPTIIAATPTYNYYCGNFNNVVVGNAVFSTSGTSITHNLNNTNHFISVIPITTNNDDAAKIGSVYSQLGLNNDIIYTTGLSDANGISFQWMVTASGAPIQVAGDKGVDVTTSGLYQVVSAVGMYNDIARVTNGGRLERVDDTHLEWQPGVNGSIGLFNGNDWVMCTPTTNPSALNTTTTISGASLTYDVNYDVFMRYGSTTSGILEFQEWATASGRYTPLARFQGVLTYDNSTDLGKKRRYLGYVRLKQSGANAYFRDEGDVRLISNHYNKMKKSIYKFPGYSSSTSETTTTDWRRFMNNDDYLIEFLSDGVSCTTIEVKGARKGNTAANEIKVGIAIDTYTNVYTKSSYGDNWATPVTVDA
jgi:hypothetical protein